VKITRASLISFAAAMALASVAATTSHAGGKVALPFDPADFPSPPVVDNSYLPLMPGTTFIYRAEGDDECEEVHVIVRDPTIAPFIKFIAGVHVLVVEDLAYIDEDCDGDLQKVEETFDWYAQDQGGNVWYLGEDTNECDETGCNDPAGSWEAGVDGAVAGLIMLAEPRPGDQYRQEFLKDEAEDQAKILRVDSWISLYRDDAIDPGEFHNCLTSKEWTRLAHGEIEKKYYCPEIGLVAVDELKGKMLRFELVEIVRP